MNLCQVVLASGWGGAETVAYELSKHLRDKGERVSLLLNQEMLKYYEDLEGVELHNIGPLLNPLTLTRCLLSPGPRPSTEWKTHNPVLLCARHYSLDLLGSAYYRRVRKQVLNYLRDRRVDVLHAHLEPSIVFASLLDDAKIPRVATLHGEYELRGMMDVHPSLQPLVKGRTRRFSRALEKMTEMVIGSIDPCAVEKKA